MRHPISINTRGKPYRRSIMSDLRDAIKMIDSWSLQPTKYIMNQSDYDDILKWNKKNK
jgi:hypothetical protein